MQPTLNSPFQTARWTELSRRGFVSSRCFRRFGAVLLAICFLVQFCGDAFASHPQEWNPTGALLDLIRRIESADGLMTVGDEGRSLGPYQLSRPAWADVNSWRRARGLGVHDYAASVFTESVSRSYAADYLKILHSRLAKRLHRLPTSAEVYAAYNMGLSAFARCAFDLNQVNSVTASNCRKIQHLSERLAN